VLTVLTDVYINTLARIALYLDTDVAHLIVTGDLNGCKDGSWFDDFFVQYVMNSYTAESYYIRNIMRLCIYA